MLLPLVMIAWLREFRYGLMMNIFFALRPQWKVGVMDTKRRAKSTAPEISLYTSSKCWMVKAGDQKIKVTMVIMFVTALMYVGTDIPITGLRKGWFT